MPSEINTTGAPGPTITSSGTNSDGSRLIPGRTLQGKNVYGQSGDVLGVIGDVIIDPSTAHIVYYVISLEGDENAPHPVPVARLGYDHAREGYISDLSREQIESAPPQHDDWYEDQAWQLRSHEHYGVSRP
ncbi:PRC-barrel domain-containing protein [Pararhodobacter sp.]|uniref:PRC-barrel domain-containing protein n=1 Tax=Pararhodobacter sp. TaxID=2127056 RepID=UPI002FDECAC8